MKKSRLEEIIREEVEIHQKENYSTVNEAFEWWQPLLALGSSIGLMAGAIFAVLGPSALSGGALMGGETWGEVIRHYKKKFRDKQAAKKLTVGDVLELVNLIQSNLDSSDLPPGVRKYMKGLMNKLEMELLKDEEDLDKDKLLNLLRDVQGYAQKLKINK